MTDKDTMPKEIFVDAKPATWGALLFSVKDPHSETATKYTRLSPDDIVISRKELEEMRELSDEIDKILEMGK